MMRVLLLSPYPKSLVDPIIHGCTGEGDEMSPEPDITVLWGHRKILTRKELVGRRVINIHISFLPYNRGASPNLWAWFEGTPHGVSIHEVVEKVDAGPILARRLVKMDEDKETLRTSYDKLQRAALRLFNDMWPAIRRGTGEIVPHPAYSLGSCHTVAQSEALMKKFPMGYDTPCSEVAELGRRRT